MAKRFIDTGLFSDSWFSDLSSNNKLFFIYLITRCDNAGIIDLNIKLAEFETGIKGLAKGWATVQQQFGKRLARLRDNYYLIPQFVPYQYPNGLKPNVNAQKSVIKRLAVFGLDFNSLATVQQQFPNSSPTVLDIVPVLELDTDKDSVLGFDEFWNLYDKKVSTEKAKKKYATISEAKRRLIKNTLATYVASTPEKRYRKDPCTYLNQESWNDEIGEVVKTPFNFATAPWTDLTEVGGGMVKVDLDKLIVYNEQGHKHEFMEVNSDGGITS